MRRRVRSFVGLFDFACLLLGAAGSWWALIFMLRQLAAVGRAWGLS